MDTIILFALPVFALLMAAEFIYGVVRGRNTYGLGDTLSSLSQGVLSQLVALCTQFIQVGIYAAVWRFVALAPRTPLWRHWPGVLLAVLLYDFCDYWLHRTSHESAIFWAAHVVHHQSEHFNLSTALRQESAYALTGFMFFLPMAVIGIPPETFAIAVLVVLFYQFWIHTEHVGSLGVFDRIFSTPSNHRVHHATNARYIDRNYGAILVVWDRMFGTFEPETERCVYGTIVPLASWDPMRAVGGGYVALFRKAGQARGWRNKLGVLFRSPSWTPATAADKSGSAAYQAATPVATAQARPADRYDPPTTAGQRSLATAIFILTVAGTGGFLWLADLLSATATGVVAVCLAASLWCIGALLERRLAPLAATSLAVLSLAGSVLVLARAA